MRSPGTRSLGLSRRRSRCTDPWIGATEHRRREPSFGRGKRACQSMYQGHPGTAFCCLVAVAKCAQCVRRLSQPADAARLPLARRLVLSKHLGLPTPGTARFSCVAVAVLPILDPIGYSRARNYCSFTPQFGLLFCNYSYDSAIARVPLPGPGGRDPRE